MKSILYSVLIFSGLALFAGSSRCQQNDTSLYNFNQNLVTTNSFLALPSIYGTTSGTDTARTIIGYSERFTSPYTNTYLDSVSILMATDSFGSNGYILVEAVPALWTSGHSYANFDSTYASAFVDSVYKKDTADLYSFPMSHGAIPDTDFFISALAPVPSQTIAFLWIDSLTSSTALSIDEDRDRSRLLLDTPYGANNANYQYYLAGQHLGSSVLYYYPNFVMIAYVSSPTGSTAEVYPTAVDPLTFYVEQTAAGETNLHFTTLDGGAQLELFDATGTMVSTLFDGGYANGEYNVPLVTDGLSSGMYFARLTSGNSSEVRRVMVTH
jgi:hypothetical protein